MRVRRLLLDEHCERIRRNICPRCKKFSLKEIFTDQLPKTKYKSHKSVWTCEGHEDFSCYILSSQSSDVLFETCEGVSLIDFSENDLQTKKVKSTVFRRRAGEVTEVKHT
jgi:hypothetical protein